MSMRRFGRHRNDRGSATVWVAMAMASLCVIFAALLAMGQGVAARHRAGGAADLAALAAADRALQGQSTACAAAVRVAGAQGARVVRCAVRDGIADLTAEARFGPYAPRVRARAGPPDDPLSRTGHPPHSLALLPPPPPPPPPQDSPDRVNQVNRVNQWQELRGGVP